MTETLEPALPDRLDSKAEKLMRSLCDRELVVATAESCTGGMLAALLTDIEGCGHGFDRGFVTYSKEAKRDLLGVDEELLERNDAVSETVTGFAGPAGDGCEEGLVHFALARRGGDTSHRVEHFGALGRGPVRVKSLEVMLEMLEEALG